MHIIMKVKFCMVSTALMESPLKQRCYGGVGTKVVHKLGCRKCSELMLENSIYGRRRRRRFHIGTRQRS